MLDSLMADYEWTFMFIRVVLMIWLGELTVKIYQDWRSNKGK